MSRKKVYKKRVPVQIDTEVNELREAYKKWVTDGFGTDKKAALVLGCSPQNMNNFRRKGRLTAIRRRKLWALIKQRDQMEPALHLPESEEIEALEEKLSKIANTLDNLAESLRIKTIDAGERLEAFHKYVDWHSAHFDELYQRFLME